MMGDQLPLIRGQISGQEDFVQVRGGGGPPAIPERDPEVHRNTLIHQLDRLLALSESRRPGKVEGATREVIAVEPSEDGELSAKALGDKREDAQVVSQDIESGVVLLDVADSHLSYMRKKLDNFADKKTASGKPKHQPAIAPIESIHVAREEDLAGARYRASALSSDDERWFELACRGGSRLPADVAEHSRRQIAAAISTTRRDSLREFVASERLWIFLRLSVTELRQLLLAVDCVFEFDIARSAIRNLILVETQPTQQIAECEIEPPESGAPSVVVLDTGVATLHPLLKDAVLSAESVSPDTPSPEDVHGHGTEMAGVCLHDDVAALVEERKGRAEHWIQGVKILNQPGTGAGAVGMERFWPGITRDGVEGAEQYGKRPRVFVLAVSGEMEDPQVGTLWSSALDLLCHNDGKGRLLCVAAGNADVSQAFLEGYPQLNLQRKLQDPAQAVNALTVGAYTAKDATPDDHFYDELEPVAPKGGISPHTTTGDISGTIKPEVVFEGGNVATDGALPDTGVPSLCVLTTGWQFRMTPLSLHCMTSCAAAEASRFAAKLWNADPSWRPETLRGLIAHSASWTEAMRTDFPEVRERLAACGFGVPNLSWARECLLDRATVIVEDVIPNAALRDVLKSPPPKREDTPKFKKKSFRVVKYFRMPIPEDELVELGDQEVELRITLSYFAEPNLSRGRVHRGMDLQWALQRREESEDEFRRRINRKLRQPDDRGRTWTDPYKWDIGPNQRGKGTLVSDRWTGPACELAGQKAIAVYPVLGWWDRRKDLQTAETRFALIVTLRAQGIDIYTPIQQAISVQVET